MIKQITAHSAKHPDKMKEAGQSDEADTSRTQVMSCTNQEYVIQYLDDNT